jgi:glycerol-3-phosphate O-acyltransferase/dihydroxyacetone phosphate acyltransferase
MLYAILKNLMRITVKVFFRNIQVRNASAVPSRAPLIIVANHPSTFTDPIVIAVILKRQVHFLAKGEAFKGGFAKWMLPRLHMIPIYRKQDDPSLMHKNKETFEKCYEHLEKNGVLLIFPEGVSFTERKLREIKTGTARIALGAEARNDFKLGVQIVSIGLNYTNPHKFREELLVNIDQPISVDDYAGKHAADPVEAVNALTEKIRESLERNVINIQDEQLDLLVKDIETIYKRKLAKDMGYSAKESREEDFGITRGIAETVHYFQVTDPARVERIGNRVRAYMSSLERVGLTDRILQGGSKGSLFVRNLRSILFIALGFPFYLYGLINNYLPFEIPSWIAARTKSPEFRGPIAMVTGTFTFLIFYTLQIWLVHHFFHRTWLTVAYGISLPLSGAFTYYYWHTLLYIRSRWRLISLFWRKTYLMADLISERQQIIGEFDKARAEYDNAHSAAL